MTSLLSFLHKFGLFQASVARYPAVSEKLFEMFDSHFAVVCVIGHLDWELYAADVSALFLQFTFANLDDTKVRCITRQRQMNECVRREGLACHVTVPLPQSCQNQLVWIPFA